LLARGAAGTYSPGAAGTYSPGAADTYSPGAVAAQEGNDESEQPGDASAEAAAAFRLSPEFRISRAPTNEEIEQIMRETLLQELDLSGSFDPAAALDNSTRAVIEQLGTATPNFHSSHLAALQLPCEVTLAAAGSRVDDVDGAGSLEQLQLGINPIDPALPDDLEAADDLLRELMAACCSNQQGWQTLDGEPLGAQPLTGQGGLVLASGGSSNLLGAIQVPAAPLDTSAAAAAAGTLSGPTGNHIPVSGHMSWLPTVTPAVSSDVPSMGLAARPHDDVYRQSTMGPLVRSSLGGAEIAPSAAPPGSLTQIQSVTDTTPGVPHTAAADTERIPRQDTQQLAAAAEEPNSLGWYELQSPLIPGAQGLLASARGRETAALQEPTADISADVLQPAAAAAAAGFPLPGQYPSPFAAVSATQGTTTGDDGFAAAAGCPIDSLPASPIAAAGERSQPTLGRQQQLEVAGHHHITSSTAAPTASQVMAPPLHMAARQQQQRLRFQPHPMQVMQPPQQQALASLTGRTSGYSSHHEQQVMPLHDSSLSSLTRHQLPLLLQGAGSLHSVAGRGETPIGRLGSWSVTGYQPSQSLGRVPSFASGSRHLAGALPAPATAAVGMPRQDCQGFGYAADAGAHAADASSGQIPVAAAFAAVDHQAVDISSAAAASGPAAALEGRSIDANVLEQRLRHMQQEALHMQQMIQMLRAQHEAAGQRHPQPEQEEPAAAPALG
jgi:hypothetical protein